MYLSNRKGVSPMKKFLAVVVAALSLLTFSGSANAWYGGYRGGCWNCGGGRWVAPAVAGLVIGGAIGYAAAPRYYAPPPVYYAPPPPPPVYYAPQPAYTQQTIFDANCNCYRTILVPVQ